jgi:hypothetical protein
MVLAIAVAAAMSVVGVGGSKEAQAQWGRGVPGNFRYGGGYNQFYAQPVGGYQAAAIRLGAYAPDYFYNPYYYGGYPYGLGGNIGPVGGVYGGSSNTIIIGF